MTPTHDLLLGLLRRDWDQASSPPMAMGDAADWTAIVETALYHGVAGLLCRSLSRLPAGDLPADIAAAAVEYLARADAQGAVVVTQLFDILDVLAAANVRAMPFKGPVLGARAHISATIRPSRDLDVLVPRPCMDHAVRALGALGYRLGKAMPRRVADACYDNSGQVILFAPDRMPVEPHCALSPRALDINLDMAGLWNRATPVVVGGRAVSTFSPEDTLLTACLHGCKDKWWRLLWVADIAALIHRHPELDWFAMLDRAEAAGVRRMFLLGLALARDLFSSSLPPSVSTAIERDPTCLWLVQRSKEHLFGPVVDVGTQNHVSRYHLNSRERIGDRVRYVWRTVTTPRVIHFRMVRLPDGLFFGYVVVKLVHDYLLLPIWVLGKGRWWRRKRDPPDAAL